MIKGEVTGLPQRTFRGFYLKPKEPLSGHYKAAVCLKPVDDYFSLYPMGLPMDEFITADEAEHPLDLAKALIRWQESLPGTDNALVIGDIIMIRSMDATYTSDILREALYIWVLVHKCAPDFKVYTQPLVTDSLRARHHDWNIIKGHKYYKLANMKIDADSSGVQ